MFPFWLNLDQVQLQSLLAMSLVAVSAASSWCWSVRG